jgi:hypothetical protein
VSVVSTGTVEIHPEHAYGTRKPLYWWLLTSRKWLPPRPINVYVIGHAKGLVLFDTAKTAPRSPTTRISRRVHRDHLRPSGQVLDNPR